MQVVLHAGAHLTDEDRLLRRLIENREMLARHGTNIPNPTSYRKLLRDTLHQAMRGDLSDAARDMLIDAIARDGAVDRLVLSNEGFFGTPKMAVSGGRFYAAAEKRMRSFADIFAHDNVELFFAIRNPATFLPALLKQTKFDTIVDMLRGVDPTAMRWSDMLTRLHDARPDIPITFWCNEDTPLIWGQILREIAGVDPTIPIKGEFELLKDIMIPEGLQRFEAYMSSHSGMNELQKRRVIAAFLNKFVDDDAVEEELDTPGWTQQLIDELTDLYDEDVYEMQRLPGVQMIST